MKIAAVFFVLLTTTVVQAQAYDYYINFKFDLGVLPKSAKQKYANAYDYKFTARNWTDALRTAQSLIGADYKTQIDPNCGSDKMYNSCQGSELIITGVELVEGVKRLRACAMGDMTKPGLQACGRPPLEAKAKIMSVRTPAKNSK